MGIPETTLSFSLINEGVDTGALIHSVVVVFELTDTIEGTAPSLVTFFLLTLGGLLLQVDFELDG